MSRLIHLVHRFAPVDQTWVYDRRRLQPAETVYNPIDHFQARETSTFLDAVMPCDYVQATWGTRDDLSIKAAQEVIVRGISKQTVPGWELEDYQYFVGTCRDNIKAVFIPRRVKLALKDIGLDMQAPFMKSAKYLNRQLAPHLSSKMGDVVGVKALPGDCHHLSVTLANGAKIDVLVRPEHKLVDGAHLCSVRGAQLLLGMPDPNIGDCMRITADTPLGLAKGHMMVADVNYDAILYGLKPGLKFNRFFFGVLSELHIGKPFSDFQTLVNMLMHSGLELLEEHALTFFEDVMKASEDHDRMRKMFLGFTDLERSQDPMDSWIMLEALKRDIDGIFPGLYRRQAKLLMDKVYDCGLGRIPLRDSAIYAYVMPVWDMFEADGTPNPAKSRFKGDCVFTPLVNQDQVIAMYRQPNGNPKEHWVTQATPAPYTNRGKGQMVFLGPDMIEKSLAAMGGGDFDDSVILVHNPKLVELFGRLPEYPS